MPRTVNRNESGSESNQRKFTRPQLATRGRRKSIPSFVDYHPSASKTESSSEQPSEGEIQSENSESNQHVEEQRRSRRFVRINVEPLPDPWLQPNPELPPADVPGPSRMNSPPKPASSFGRSTSRSKFSNSCFNPYSSRQNNFTKSYTGSCSQQANKSASNQSVLPWDYNYTKRPIIAPNKPGEPFCLASMNQYHGKWNQNKKILSNTRCFNQSGATDQLRYGTVYPSARVTQITFTSSTIDVLFEDNTFLRTTMSLFLDILNGADAATILRIDGQASQLQFALSVPFWQGFLSGVETLRLSGSITFNLLTALLQQLPNNAITLSAVCNVNGGRVSIYLNNIHALLRSLM